MIRALFVVVAMGSAETWGCRIKHDCHLVAVRLAGSKRVGVEVFARQPLRRRFAEETPPWQVHSVEGGWIRTFGYRALASVVLSAETRSQAEGKLANDTEVNGNPVPTPADFYRLTKGQQSVKLTVIDPTENPHRKREVTLP